MALTSIALNTGATLQGGPATTGRWSPWEMTDLHDAMVS